jgi:hypothetical protein
MLDIALLVAQNTSNLKGDYLGQKPPGLVPELFAKGVISTEYKEHGSPTFSKDGDKLFWWSIKIESGKQWINISKL